MQQKIQITSLYVLAISLLTCFSSLSDANAQCRIFVRTCVTELHPYIHDGSYQAVIMTQGEEAEVYKTVFAGQQYRLYICADHTLPNVEFIVSDFRRNILFDNRKNNNTTVWNFKFDSSQQIKVTIRIPKSSQGDATGHVFGCVGVLFGLLEQ